MPRREFIPIVVELEGDEYEVQADGTVYLRRRPCQRLRKVHTTSQPFRTEEATLRRVKDPELVRRALEAAAGADWTDGVRVKA